MNQSLPVGNFQWISAEWIQSIADDSKEGYIFIVDLHVPSHLHDYFNDYPLAPEKLKVS